VRRLTSCLSKTPSLVITPKENLWHCLGACQAGGSVIDWVMRSEGFTFRHAIELLREGLPAAAISSQAPSRPPRFGACRQRWPRTDQEVLRQVVGFYHQTLLESPEAVRFLESRGLSCGTWRRAFSSATRTGPRATGCPGQLDRVLLQPRDSAFMQPCFDNLRAAAVSLSKGQCASTEMD